MQIQLQDLKIKSNINLKDTEIFPIYNSEHYVDHWLITKDFLSVNHRKGSSILPPCTLIKAWGKTTFSAVCKTFGRIYDVTWDHSREVGKLDNRFFYPLLDQRWFQSKILKGQPPYLYKESMAVFGQPRILTDLGFKIFYSRDNGNISFDECKKIEPYFDPENLWFCGWGKEREGFYQKSNLK